jgi:hypothetical protein
MARPNPLAELSADASDVRVDVETVSSLTSDALYYRLYARWDDLFGATFTVEQTSPTIAIGAQACIDAKAAAVAEFAERRKADR